MNEESTPKSKARHPDRINLEPLLLEKVDHWLEQIRAHRKGIKIKRKDIVCAILGRAPEKLPDSEVAALSDTFYDEERYLKELLSDLRRAKKRGEKVELGNLSLLVGAAPKPRRKRQARKKEESTENSNYVPSSAEKGLRYEIDGFELTD